jgi:hypothetical protein
VIALGVLTLGWVSRKLIAVPIQAMPPNQTHVSKVLTGFIVLETGAKGLAFNQMMVWPSDCYQKWLDIKV